MKTPPKHITDAGLNMYVDTVKLRELPLPIVEIPIANLLWHFDMPVWAKDGTEDWNLSPRDVLEQKEGSKGHYERMQKADISHPLVVTDYNGRLVILDGVHRLLKMYIDGAESIRAKIIPSEYLSRKELQT